MENEEKHYELWPITMANERRRKESNNREKNVVNSGVFFAIVSGLPLCVAAGLLKNADSGRCHSTDAALHFHRKTSQQARSIGPLLWGDDGRPIEYDSFLCGLINPNEPLIICLLFSLSYYQGSTKKSRPMASWSSISLIAT